MSIKKVGSLKGIGIINNNSGSNLSEKSRLSSVVYPSKTKKNPNNFSLHNSQKQFLKKNSNTSSATSIGIRVNTQENLPSHDLRKSTYEPLESLGDEE